MSFSQDAPSALQPPITRSDLPAVIAAGALAPLGSLCALGLRCLGIVLGSLLLCALSFRLAALWLAALWLAALLWRRFRLVLVQLLLVIFHKCPERTNAPTCFQLLRDEKKTQHAHTRAHALFKKPSCSWLRHK